MHLLLSQLTQIPQLAIVPEAESVATILPSDETARFTATISGVKADDALLTFDQVLAQETAEPSPPQADAAPETKGVDSETDPQKPAADENEMAEHPTKKQDPADEQKTSLPRAESAPELAQLPLKKADIRDHLHQGSPSSEISGPSIRRRASCKSAETCASDPS